MFEISWHAGTVALFTLYCLCGFFNLGVVVAFGSRYHLKVSWKLSEVVALYFMSLCLAALGPFCWPTIFTATSLPDYGWKLWPGEIGHPKNKWFYRWREKVDELEQKRKREEFFSSPAGGYCRDIWGDNYAHD